MYFPGPFRATVGLVAYAVDAVKDLPDRAIEVPMLAVSSALQMSLRAQQQYARLAARGDAVLKRTALSEEPPQWATFDDPVSVDELRQAALTQLESLSEDGTMSGVFENLFGVPAPGTLDDEKVDDGAVEVAGRSDAPADGAEDDGGTNGGRTNNVTPIGSAFRTNSRPSGRTAAPTRNTTPTPARKATPRKAAGNLPSTSAAEPVTPVKGKSVSKPRRTPPSKFDAVED